MRTSYSLVSNPPWVADLIALAYPKMQDEIRPQWLPKFGDVLPGRGNRISAEVEEYGCGAYGCVLPTLDPKVVLKVTTDDTEAEFAGGLANTLSVPICVRYYAVLPMGVKHKDRPVTMLWRESADYVGHLDEYLAASVRPDMVGDIQDYASALIHTQWEASQVAFRAIYTQAPQADQQAAIGAWLATCETMARQTHVPELRALGHGLVDVYVAQGVVFGDMHEGNIGLVHRSDGDRWVITDPGHIAVVA
jgi:hypothetical protein